MADTNKLVEIDHVKAKLMELMAEFFGVDPAYYNIDSSGLADHLIANGVTVQDSNPIGIDRVSRWIPVSERLPKDRQEVLCFKKGKYGQCVMTAAFSECLEKYCDYAFHGVKHGGFFDYDSDIGYYELCGVTHWMTLPEPPEEVEQ